MSTMRFIVIIFFAKGKIVPKTFAYIFTYNLMLFKIKMFKFATLKLTNLNKLLLLH